VLDQPAQAFGRCRDRRKAEGRRLTLDVVGGVEQGVAAERAEASSPGVAARRVEPVALCRHPVREFTRKLRQRIFDAHYQIAGRIRSRRASCAGSPGSAANFATTTRPFWRRISPRRSRPKTFASYGARSAPG